MPAGTSSSVGASGVREAGGGTRGARFSKKRRNRRRISADLIGPTSLLVPVLQPRCLYTECLPELFFTLCGVGLDLAPPRGDAFARSASLGCETFRRPLVCRRRHPTYDENPGRRAERDVEQTPHRPLFAFRSALRSALTRLRTSASRRSVRARRTPYENAATLMTGEPTLAAKTLVSADTFVVAVCRLAVIASTRSSSALT